MSDILTLTMNPAIDLSVVADAVGPTHKIRCRDERREAGGGGINVARVVRRLGGDCRALFPSGGVMGALLEQLVAAEGISAEPMAIAGETRESFTATDVRTGEQFRFVMPGPTVTEAERKACLAHLRDCGPPRFIVASGSLPPGCPPEFHADVARIAADTGARLVVDSSGASLAAALSVGVFLCKPSLSELEGVVGRELRDPGSQREAVEAIVADGRAEAVALTLGGDGAMLATAEGSWRAPPLAVEVASAVGAGDSFLAGFIWALSREFDWPEAFAWAVAAGTAAVLTPGSELAERADIVRLHDQVSVQRFA